MSTEAWRRLTKKEAVNWFIVSLILSGMDSENELIADGDPGPFLEKRIGNQSIDERFHDAWPDFGTNPYPTKPLSFSSEELRFDRLIDECARRIGYRGSGSRGIIQYLRGLPDTGPIG